MESTIDMEGNFYLMMYSTHFIYSYMVKDLSYSKRENPLLQLYGLLFLISCKQSLFAPSVRQDSTYHDLCYTSHGALAGM